MPEVTIKYKEQKTLEALKGISKYFGFVISKPVVEKKSKSGNSSIIAGDPTIDISELFEIFTGKDVNPKDVRKKAWQRKK